MTIMGKGPVPVEIAGGKGDNRLHSKHTGEPGMSEKQGREIAETSGGRELATDSINLRNTDVLDLAGLSEAEKAELKLKHVGGMLDIKKKADELRVDVGALDAALGSFTDQASKASQSGLSATIQFKQTSKIGTTEAVIGNTERAASGKMAIDQDKLIWMIGIAAAAAVVIALIVAN